MESPIRVAIVDDNMFMRKLLRGILEKNSFEVVAEFSDPEKLIAEYETLKPDLITMDLVMEKITGIQALEKIMAIDSKANVVMISAVGRSDVIIKAIKLGAKDYLVKPFVERNILDTISKIF